MRPYIVDTVAFLGYLANSLPSKANKIFKQAEKKELDLLLPSITLGEPFLQYTKRKKFLGERSPLLKSILID